jgi:hypothetical protein
MVEERALARRTDAADLGEAGRADVLLAPAAMGADGEAVGLVAQALQKVEHGIARLEAEGFAPRHVEGLAARLAVAALGDADEGNVVDAELGEDRPGRGELAGAAVDQHQIGP